MLLETSLQAQVLIPMACSLIFGLITGTLLILILVPVFYHIYGTVLLMLGMPLFVEDEFGDPDDPSSKSRRGSSGKESPSDLEPALAREIGKVGPAV